MQREKIRGNGRNLENTRKPFCLASSMTSLRQVRACCHSGKTLANSANVLGTHHWKKSPFFLAGGRVGLLTPAGTDAVAEGPRRGRQNLPFPSNRSCDCSYAKHKLWGCPSIGTTAILPRKISSLNCNHVSNFFVIFSFYCMMELHTYIQIRYLCRPSFI